MVEGTLDEPVPPRTVTSCDSPGDLQPIVEALDLPVVAVVSCREIGKGIFHLPRLPEGVDAVLLDELGERSLRLPRLKRMIHLAAGLPVIGAIETMPAARAVLETAPARPALARRSDRRSRSRLLEARRHRGHS